MSEDVNRDQEKRESGAMVFGRWLGRLVIIGNILAIVSFLAPGFSIRGFWSFVIAAVVISILDYLVERIIHVNATPFGNGIKGFIISAIIIYVTQYFVPHMTVSIIGAIIAAIIIGILDAIFPNHAKVM